MAVINKETKIISEDVDTTHNISFAVSRLGDEYLKVERHIARAMWRSSDRWCHEYFSVNQTSG